MSAVEPVVLSCMMWDGRTVGWGSTRLLRPQHIIDAPMRTPSPAFVGTATMTNWSRDASAYGRRELQGLDQDGALADLGITLKASAVPRMSPLTSCHGSGLLRGSTCPPRASMATGIASLSMSTGMPLHAGTVARGMMQFEGGRRRLGATGGMRLRSGTLRPLPTTAWAGSRAVRRCRLILRRILPEAARGATPRLREAPMPTSWRPTSSGTEKE